MLVYYLAYDKFESCCRQLSGGMTKKRTLLEEEGQIMRGNEEFFQPPRSFCCREAIRRTVITLSNPITTCRSEWNFP
jgi:hypothetical protein